MPGMKIVEHIRHVSAICAALICWPVDASPQDLSISPIFGTLGPGIEGSFKLSSSLVLRGSWNYADFGGDEDIDGVEYDADVLLHSFGLNGDLHPFANGFRLSAGLRYNLNEADIQAMPRESVTIGNTTYTPAEIGRLDGGVEFNDLAPYLGIGFDNALFGSSAVSFKADLGLLYQGDPDVQLSASSGTLAADPGFQDDLERERQDIEDDLEILGFYPVLALGLSIRF